MIKETKMKLIKSHNESIEGNEAIRKINLELIENEIKSLSISLNRCWSLDEMDEIKDMIEELEELKEDFM